MYTSGKVLLTVSVVMLIMSSCTPPNQPTIDDSDEQAGEQTTNDEQCTEYFDIEAWTVRVIDTDNNCVVRSYSWQFDESDYRAYDRADQEWTWTRDYLLGWAVTESKDNGANYVTEWRRN